MHAKMKFDILSYFKVPFKTVKFQWTSRSVNFISLVTSLFWASGGGATDSSSHVLYMGVSYSRSRAHGMLNSYPIN